MAETRRTFQTSQICFDFFVVVDGFELIQNRKYSLVTDEGCSEKESKCVGLIKDASAFPFSPTQLTELEDATVK